MLTRPIWLLLSLGLGANENAVLIVVQLTSLVWIA
jgi:hypothetical protein